VKLFYGIPKVFKIITMQITPYPSFVSEKKVLLRII
jgi:hypothetical protein